MMPPVSQVAMENLVLTRFRALFLMKQANRNPASFRVAAERTLDRYFKEIDEALHINTVLPRGGY